MASLSFQPVRAAFRSERLPATVMWLLAADGMSTFVRTLARALTDALEDRAQAKAVTAEVMARMWRRRVAVHLENASDRQVAAFMAGLYPTPQNRKTRWMYAALGGPPARRERLETLRLTGRMGPRARWDELATHLGELLIVMTEDLGELGVQRHHQVLSRMCFASGQAYGEAFKRRYDLPDTAASAIEVLRVSEYIWQVNPEHESHGEGQHGYIDGSACPWHPRPGWKNVHCGIFGQFQNGVASVFGMDYILTTTIPRHGGDHCRIDLVPIGEPRPKSAATG